MVGPGSLVGRAAEEFGLQVVEALLQQQGARLLVGTEENSQRDGWNPGTKMFNVRGRLRIWKPDASEEQR